MSVMSIIALAIFLITLFFVITEKIDRTIAAMGGAILMIICGIIPAHKVIGYIDFNTIGVLVGMMLVVSVVKNSGVFEYVAIFVAKKSKGSALKILISFAIITAVLSAILDNVTTVLLIGPMTIVICKMLNLNPIPFLITQILASNIGGMSTLIGDPPNIMIGSASGLGFSDFLINIGPAALIILVATILIMSIVYKKQLFVEDKFKDDIMKLDEKKSIKDKTLLIKSIIVMVLILLGFIFHSAIGIESSIVALFGAVILLFIGKQDIEEIFHSVEWPTIAFFAGLFVLVGGLEETGIIHYMAEWLISITSGNLVLTMLLLLWLSAIVSSFLDNIPFVATLIPLILTMGQNGMDITPLWWAVSLGACLGGNGTLIGASANVVLSNIANKNGHKLTFGKYFKVGFPMMLLSIVISTVYVLIVFA